MATSSNLTGTRLAAHGRRLALLLHHFTGPAIRARVEIEDLVQEVFLRALQTPRGLPSDAGSGDQALWAFLARIARNTVVDVARALRARKRSGRETRLDHSTWSRTGSFAVDPAARGPGPVTRLVAGETVEALQRSFDALPPDHQRVIGLRQFEGLSAELTGRRMGRSASAVHSLYRRALQAWDAQLPEDLRVPGIAPDSF